MVHNVNCHMQYFPKENFPVKFRSYYKSHLIVHPKPVQFSAAVYLTVQFREGVNGVAAESHPPNKNTPSTFV